MLVLLFPRIYSFLPSMCLGKTRLRMTASRVTKPTIQLFMLLKGEFFADGHPAVDRVEVSDRLLHVVI